MLKDLIEEIDTGEIDLEITGFSLADLGELMGKTFVDKIPEDFKEIDENIKTEHECPKCGYKWS